MDSAANAWAGAGPPPGGGDAQAADIHWERWLDAAGRSGDEATRAFAGRARADAWAGPLFSAAFAHSPYLSRCLVAEPPFARLLAVEGPDAAMAAALAGAGAGPPDESEADLMARLRVAKRRAALAAGMADIAGAWPLERVTGALSDLAEAALRAASGHLLRNAGGGLVPPHPDDPERDTGLVVLGMGKLGGRELNYSSDIDLIVLYDEEAAERAGARDPRRTFVRIAQGLARIVGARTPHGYVFRTDLRLRPDPGSTPPAVSVRSAATYYRDAGRDWERAAMIKARPVAGDAAAAAAFLERLRPFVWRGRLDFAAAQDIRAMKQRIDAARGGGANGLAGHNVKLGRGGIREIEFFVQAQQLLWGGRDPALRARGTLEALDLLVRAGHVARETAEALESAYRYLRGVEHRLQMTNDQQTHSLPESAEGMEATAAFLGYGSAAAFVEAARARIETVERHFAALFEDRLAAAAPRDLVLAGEADDPATLAALAAMGYADPGRASAIARGWAAGRVPATRSERARDLLARLAPAALAAFAASPEPDAALARFDGFLARLPAGVQLFSLLAARPELLGLLALVLGSAPRLAGALTRHPALFDGVLSREFADLELPDDDGMDPETTEAARRGLVRLFYLHEFGRDEMREQLAAAAARANDLQDLMDIERRWANEKAFQIGLHMLRGLLSPVEASRPLTAIAEVCLDLLMPALVREFAADHGHVPGGRVAVVAFGKLGSREMTAGSDLDLLFLYDHAPGRPESDGRRPLAANAYYARLCRRLIGAVSAPTAEGKLYDVDMRLRPSGNSGPIACSLESFEAYQREQAWTWEHQALTRARTIYAEGGLDERFEEIRRAVLARPRDPAALAADIAGMRDRIRREHGGGDIWSIKHMPGGLLDIEFIAQHLQLRHAAEAPDILAGDLLSVFEAAGARGLVDAGAARELADAARLWRNLQGILRLTAEGDFDQETATVASKNVIGQSCGALVFNALVESIRETADRAARRFDELVRNDAGAAAEKDGGG